MNASLITQSTFPPPMQLASVKNAAAVSMLMEGHGTSDGGFAMYQTWYKGYRLHDGKANVLYVDGHVSLWTGRPYAGALTAGHEYLFPQIAYNPVFWGQE